MRPIMAKAIGYMQPTIDPNMRLYVPFNEGVGTIAKDYSQYGNHAQFTDVEWSIGKGGNAGVFNGTSSYCDCGNDASLDITDAITIEAGIKLDQLPTEAGVESYILNKNKYLAYVSKASNKLAFKITSGGTTKTLVSIDALIINTWYHLVMKFDPSTQRGYIYINGVERSTYWGVSVIDNSLANSLWIGSSGIGRANGLIEELRIYNRALSAAQIAADYYEMVGN